MEIKRITKSEFDRFRPLRDPTVTAFAEEREWFADESGNVLGVLLRDSTDDDWALVVLGRDERGSFRAIETDVSIEDQETARSRLLRALSRISEQGQVVFPQGD